MRVEFFERRGLREKAFFANSDELCEVEIVRVHNGAVLNLDRWHADLEMTNAASKAIFARWKQEIPLLKRQPQEMYFVGGSVGGMEDGGEIYPLHTELSVAIGWGMLKGWKQFLRELLSRPESWESHRREKQLRKRKEPL